MTDVSHVSLALAYRCAGLIYPDGMAAPSVTGRQTIVRRGGLLPSDLFSAQSVRNSVDYVTVAASMDGYRACPEPLGRPWSVGRRIAPTVGVSCSGAVATVSVPLSGVICGVVGLRWSGGSAVSATAAYAASGGETAADIAAGLAQGLSGARAEGGRVIVPSGCLDGQVAGYGESFRVTRRQSQRLRVSIWTTSAAARDLLGGVLDTSLAALSWLPMVDGGQAQLSFEGAGDVDNMQTQAVYRRDMVFRTVFDTRQTAWSAQMMFGVGDVAGPGWDVGFGDAMARPAGQGDVAALAAQGMGPVDAYPGLTIDAFGTVQAV
ncbi:hypothetical protein AA101099_1522 [Neoasaia chiangmaiensis NBRC 101099]|uniref:Uncharacterized protein n=1 Tax=Neoasaia chiangmaiensis TaxID=320497 RepID=A0A1U9KQ45_9PROT|nr:hypothetical protein [Neoasaia chiangmaiensis]AQS87913.1 hypothetical protein A0U93_08125 [Neoasaia chiangmaiensis]GBR39116.1 hypothetical protein AA101099_1522 [Neoasaia chiangmaiensis NBRC 101099]GEN15560.1 hypothetical protein NCH01_19910 [Neoasaia chiangmaiensis]